MTHARAALPQERSISPAPGSPRLCRLSVLAFWPPCRPPSSVNLTFEYSVGRMETEEEEQSIRHIQSDLAAREKAYDSMENETYRLEQL